MGSIRFGLLVILVLASIAAAKDVFRYVDEETGQSHYMTGEPGKNVEGGWTFTNGDQTFELVYKADEGGFQPEAEYIPAAVEDTNEVALAKTQFYSLYEEAKARALEAPDEAIEEAEQTIVEVSKREAHAGIPPHPAFRRFPRPDPDMKYTYDPFYGFKPLEEKEGENKKIFKFVPYRGFVPDTEEKTEEAPMEAKLFKLIPYKGFVPVKEGEEDSKEKLFKMHPYYGYIPADEEEPKLKFHPRFGWVPDLKEEKPKDDGKDYVYSPYYGFIPADKVKDEDKPAFKFYSFRNEMAGRKFRFVPGYGFIPKEEEEKAEASRKKRADDVVEDAVEEVKEIKEGAMKSQELFNPLHTPMKYQFHPYHGFVPVPKEGEEKEEEKRFKYVPYYGFVPVQDEKEGEKEEKEPVLYKYNPFRGFVQVKEGEEEPKNPLEEQEYQYHPYLGFIPIQAKKDEEGAEEKPVKTYKFHPYYGFVEIKDEDAAEKPEEPLYKFVPYYGFVPVTEKKSEETETKEEEKKANHISYSFHPYYGYLPTVVKSGEEKKEQLYRHDPFLGFVPVKDEDEAKEEEAVEGDARKKREAQTFIYPQLAGQYFTVYPSYQPLAFQQVKLSQEDNQQTPASTKPLEGNKPAILPGLQPVLVPGILIPQLPVVLPAGQALPLPENQFPVIPNEPDNDEQGADEF